MQCRVGCGACCIAPSIASPIPGMLNGKPAGVRCVQLDKYNQCQLFGSPQRPLLCDQFKAEITLCGETRTQAIELITVLENETRN